VLPARQFGGERGGADCATRRTGRRPSATAARGAAQIHWLLAQMGADDCQRDTGLKCLLLRKVGKANMENFEDLRRRLFGALPHEFGISRRAQVRERLTHHRRPFQSEKDIDAYLGLEYDVIGIGGSHDAVEPQASGHIRPWLAHVQTGTGDPHLFHHQSRWGLVMPGIGRGSPPVFWRETKTETRFIPARVADNRFNNP